MLTQTTLQDRPARAGLPEDWHAAMPSTWTPEDAGKATLMERHAETVAILNGDGSVKLMGLFHGMTIEGVLPADHALAQEVWARYWEANPFRTH